MQNIQQLIGEAGGKMEDMCKVVVYITDTRHREAVYRTMGKYLEYIPSFHRSLCDSFGTPGVVGRDRCNFRNSRLKRASNDFFHCREMR